MVRLSGPQCLEVLGRLWQGEAPLAVERRPHAAAGSLRLPGLNAPLPAVLYLWPTARSYTREPLAELHLIGSPPRADAVVGALCAAGARLAERGEFTLRAFLAGRLDLTQAEAVLGVIDARNTLQLETALAQLAGGLARPLADLKDELLELLAHVEAAFDFADERLDFLPRSELAARLERAAQRAAELRDRLRRRGLGEPLPRVVLVGRPNAGKSSLFNALVARHGRRHESAAAFPALVSAVAGTTRDYLTAVLDLDGIACELVDTAGIGEAEPASGPSTARAHRSASGAPARPETASEAPQQREQEPVRSACGPRECGRAIASARVPLRGAGHPDEQAQRATATLRRQACIELWCVDCTGSATEPADPEAAAERLLVWTKADAAPARVPLTMSPHAPDARVLPGVVVQEKRSPWGGAEAHAVVTSAVTGEGLDALAARLRGTLAGLNLHGGDAVASTAQRAEEHLRAAQEALQAACELARTEESEELLAVEIRGALDALGCVAGSVYTEDLLDRIFSRFCIGK